MNIIEQLNYIYYNFEPWHKNILSVKDITLYHKTMIDRGCLMYSEFEGDVKGYVEVWKIDDAQLGRLCRDEGFAAVEEDTNSGSIVWIANLWISPVFRGSNVLKELYRMVVNFAGDHEYIAGKYNKKNWQPYRIYTKDNVKLGV